MTLPRRAAARVLLAALMLSPALAYVQAPLDNYTALPQNHAYQKTLRAWFATLEARDFEAPLRAFSAPATTDTNALFRLWLFNRHSLDMAAVRRPPEGFTLAAVESGPSLRLPANPNECQMLAFFATWDYPGNPHYGSAALKRRALLVAAADLIMLDTLHEENPQGANRSDYLGGNLIWIADTFRRAGDILPPEPRAAFAAGLEKLVRRLNDWGPNGAMVDMDLFAPVGLWYAQQALQKPEITELARAYARRLFTEEDYCHPAGYFVDNGCFDTSYNGISLCFGAWAALASDWPFAREAMTRALDLRAHLLFPNPDQGFSGPSAMSSRTSGDPARDQWQFDPRMQTQAMLSDHALFSAATPTAAELAAAPAKLAATLNAHATNGLPAEPRPWRESHWSRHLNFAAVHLPDGHAARRIALREAQSPLLHPPFRRADTFVRAFADAFVIGRMPAYGFAIHTGPVGRSFGHNNLPYGFGGGQLSVFWSPDSGVTLAGRRRGVQGGVIDSWSEWQAWPVHAVSGLAADGAFLSSSRIRKPTPEPTLAPNRARVRVSGNIPLLRPADKKETESGLVYARSFDATPAGLRVETSVRQTNTLALAELFETIPLFLQETAGQPESVVHVRVGETWEPAKPGDPARAVTAIRLERFQGGMEIAFDRARSVRFSPVWTDGYQTRARCVTALVDLLADPPDADGRRTVAYVLTPYIPEKQTKETEP